MVKTKYSNSSKLALMLTVLGFVNIAFGYEIGMFIGFFLSLMGLYIAQYHVKVFEPKNDLLPLTLFFGLASYFVMILILVMKYLI